MSTPLNCPSSNMEYETRCNFSEIREIRLTKCVYIRLLATSYLIKSLNAIITCFKTNSPNCNYKIAFEFIFSMEVRF